MKLEHLPRLILSVAGAATIAAAGFAAGNIHGYQTATENATTVAAQELTEAENSSYNEGFIYGFNSGYDSGYSAGETAATVNGWYIDTTETPSGEVFYSICSTETGNGYGIYVCGESGLEMMTTETPLP